MQYQCDICSKSYSTNFNRLKHIRKAHDQTIYLKKSNISCVECKKTFKYLKDLRAHLTSNHAMEEQTTIHNFNTFAEFKTWKGKEEVSNSYRYVAIRGAIRLANGKIKKEFACHRSGFEKRQVENPIKRQCSYKLNATCPSCIDVVINENGSVDATFYRSHIYHNKEIKYLAMSREERAVIGTKLAEGYSFSEILDHVKNLSDKEELSPRFFKLTRKDLHNIKNYFKFQDNYELNETDGKLKSVIDERCNQIDRKFIERDVLKSHKQGCRMKKKDVIPHPEKSLVWLIKSYEVILLKPVMCDCDIKCLECQICVHMMKCNCYEASSNENTICSHIHALVNQCFRDEGSILKTYLSSKENEKLEEVDNLPVTRELECARLVEIERDTSVDDEGSERTIISESISQVEDNIIVYSFEFDEGTENDQQVSSFLNFLEGSLNKDY